MAKNTTTPAPAAPAPAMPAPSLLNRLGVDVVLDPMTPLVDRVNLRMGTLVRYLKVEPVQREGGNPWKKHHFLSHDDRRFGVGGTAQLDSKLKLVRPNQVMFLQYQDQDAEGTHQWRVTRIEAVPQQLTSLKEGELRENLRAFESVLDAAYEREEARQAEFRARRQGGQQVPPPHDDESYTG